MGIKTPADYVKFYQSLEMGNEVSFLSFINNEKRVLKGKLKNKSTDGKKIENGIQILEELTKEINEIGEEETLVKYAR